MDSCTKGDLQLQKQSRRSISRRFHCQLANVNGPGEVWLMRGDPGMPICGAKWWCSQACTRGATAALPTPMLGGEHRACGVLISRDNHKDVRAARMQAVDAGRGWLALFFQDCTTRGGTCSKTTCPMCTCPDGLHPECRPTTPCFLVVDMRGSMR